MSVRVACDSLAAVGTCTASGATLFAKNSDRPAAECQPLVQLPRQRHEAGTSVRCQYVEIPQIRETARLIGSRPFWLWGFEHGLNEHGVAIGNHTVFTKDPLEGEGLIGMDLVRLGLERSQNARQAAEVLCSLIQTYGQGGSGYFDRQWSYHNSFLIADSDEAVLLETSDRRWALRHVGDLVSASNHLTIGQDWTAIADGAIEHAIESGWWDEQKSDRRFDFAAAYRDESLVPPVISSGRHRRTCEILNENRGKITPALLRTALRDHYGQPAPRPELTFDDDRSFSVCMHADPVGTTTASLVAELGRNDDGLLRCWASLGSPCVGVFLPYYMEGDLPPALGRGGQESTPDSPWWRFKELLTLVERDFGRYAPPVREAWDRFESDTLRRAETIETEAVQMRRAGDSAAAVNHLSRFMADNVAETLEQVERLIRDQP